MKKLLIATALASTALAGTAFADETGPYATIEGGGVKNERANIYDSLGNQRTDRFSTGWEVAARSDMTSVISSSKLKVFTTVRA